MGFYGTGRSRQAELAQLTGITSKDFQYDEAAMRKGLDLVSCGVDWPPSTDKDNGIDRWFLTERISPEDKNLCTTNQEDVVI
jgi:hypothetical protein